MLTREWSSEIFPVDLTDSKTDLGSLAFTPEDVVVIAVPSYGGRVPGTVVKRLRMMKGNGAKAILVCVYGNRAYEDTLVELQDATERAGCRIIAAVAAIAEHSIVRQYAAGRPDEQDQKQLLEFARRIQEKLSSENFAEPKIPGNRPYKRSSGGGIVPKTSRDCTECGVCARQCPVQAIDLKDPSNTDKKAYLLYEVRLCLPAFGKKRKRHHAEGGKYRAEKSLLRSQGRGIVSLRKENPAPVLYGLPYKCSVSLLLLFYVLAFPFIGFFSFHF